MTIRVRELVPDDQLLVLNADLGEVEWEGNLEDIHATASGITIMSCRNERRTLLQTVEERGMWSSPQYQQCTSDQKRGPLTRETRRYLKVYPRFGGRVVNCIGIRAAESNSRSKRKALSFNSDNSKAGREWWDWLPIFDLETDEVFDVIANAGQVPHWAYAAGMSRVSHVFCITASRANLTTAARLRPDLYRRYVELERRIGHTLSMDRCPLEAVTGLSIESANSPG